MLLIWLMVILGCDHPQCVGRILQGESEGGEISAGGDDKQCIGLLVLGSSSRNSERVRRSGSAGVDSSLTSVLRPSDCKPALRPAQANSSLGHNPAGHFRRQRVLRPIRIGRGVSPTESNRQRVRFEILSGRTGSSADIDFDWPTAFRGSRIG